jgi:hypothetical protein
MVDDTVFVDPIGGVLVRLSNPERRTWDDHKFTFGQNTVEEFQSVLTPGEENEEASDEFQDLKGDEDTYGPDQIDDTLPGLPPIFRK